MHLPQRRDRFGKILERSSTQEKVERSVLEGHVRCIAAPKFRVDLSLLGILTSNLDKGAADVQARDSIAAELGQFNHKVSRARRQFQYAGSRRNLSGYPTRERLELIEALPGYRGVPSGREA